MKTLNELLRASAARRQELCPRQVLGVRMGMLAGALLNLDLPQADKRLLAIVETDGCATDGIAAATGCAVGRRTMRIEDFGKVAATFVDTATERAVRIVPRLEARALARDYAPEASSRWHAQLAGYQRMPDERLLHWEWVTLLTPVRAIIARDGVRVLCEVCQEEIINDRQVARDGVVLCRACAGQAYYCQLGERATWVSPAQVPCLQNLVTTQPMSLRAVFAKQSPTWSSGFATRGLLRRQKPPSQ